MENLKTVSALVKNILEHDHKARNTDNHLYLMVLEHYSGLRGIDIHAMTVPVFLKELDRRSFPGFETVRRSRQKVQATYPDLAPSEAVGKRRAKNEVVYRESKNVTKNPSQNRKLCPTAFYNKENSADTLILIQLHRSPLYIQEDRQKRR